MRINLSRLVIFLSLVAVMLGFNFTSYAEADEIVRVAIVKDAKEVLLSIRGSYQIVTLGTNEQLQKGRYLWRSKVTVSDSGLKIGKLDLKIYGFRIQPVRSPVIYVNGRKFRGAIEISRQPNNTLLVVNHLDVEKYIAGVLYHEISPRWPLEAIKAQAIAARTYALYQVKHNEDKQYDLVSTVASQVYGGRTSERGRTSKAVKRTKSEVLTYKNKIFPTFYHATCAGHTENAKNLWRISIMPLRGRECQFCQRSPHFKWKAKMGLKSIAEALLKSGYKTGAINSINIIERYISARISDLEVNSSAGKLELSGYRFRLALGPNVIRSANFDLKLKKDKIYFEGLGWGHGVGMCQWGAFFMSKKRFNADEILGFYYPESKIKKIEEIRDNNGKIKTF